MDRLGGQVPRSYLPRPQAVDALDTTSPSHEAVPQPTAREARLAAYRSRLVESTLHSPGAPHGQLRLLSVAALLAGVPACLMASAVLATLLSAFALALGLPPAWAGVSEWLLDASFSIGRWLTAACASSLVLVIVSMVRGRPRDLTGRPVRRGRPAVALAVSAVNLVVLTPMLAAGATFLYIVTAYVCGGAPGMCS